MNNPSRNETAQPVSAAQSRIVQLDVLRGFAVLGIYWINVVIFGLPYGAYALPGMLGEAHNANIATWAFSEIFISGTMRGLFSMLFGASAMILLDEFKLASHSIPTVDRYFRRNMLLILFGLIHAYFLLWPYDVLYAYGLFGFFIFPLRKLSPKILLIAGCLLLIASDIDIIQLESANKQHGYNQSQTNLADSHTESTTKQTSRSKSRQIESLEIQFEDDTELHRSGYRTIFLRQLDDVAGQQSTYIYSKHVFDIGGMMLIGMSLLKLGVLSGRRSIRFYLLLTVIGYLSGILFRGFTVYSELRHGFNIGHLSQHNLIDYDFNRLPITLGHIGLISLLCKYQFSSGLTRLLGNVGRMALTNYLLQTLISIFVFYGVGFGLIGEFERYQLIFVCLTMWVFLILFSRYWLSYYQFGPLEWAWRSLTYGKLQPLRKIGTA